jgi:hypothetical protein
MDSIAISNYGELPNAGPDELKDFVHRNNVWHNENIREKSDYFSPELIDDFTTQVAKEFIEWIKTISNLRRTLNFPLMFIKLMKSNRKTYIRLL